MRKHCHSRWKSSRGVGPTPELLELRPLTIANFAELSGVEETYDGGNAQFLSIFRPRCTAGNMMASHRLLQKTLSVADSRSRSKDGFCFRHPSGDFAPPRRGLERLAAGMLSNFIFPFGIATHS